MAPPRAAYVKVRNLLDRIKGGQAGIAAIDQLIAEEVTAERERCAKIAEEHGVGQITVAAQVAAETIAAAIRQGSEGE